MLNKSEAWFDDATRTFQFPSQEMNFWYNKKYIDNFNKYQSAFNVYGVMRMNSLKKFIIHEMEGSPLIWQTHNSCSWDPISGVTHGKKELEPDKIKVNVEQCYDEFFESCFKHYLNWG